MDILITVIGNAVVDPFFRKMFLKDPISTTDSYRFRFTKGDFEIMQEVFGGLNEEEQKQLDDLFLRLENALYQRLGPERLPCRPCRWSAYPPTDELREKLEEFVRDYANQARAKQKAA